MYGMGMVFFSEGFNVNINKGWQGFFFYVLGNLFCVMYCVSVFFNVWLVIVVVFKIDVVIFDWFLFKFFYYLIINCIG